MSLAIKVAQTGEQAGRRLRLRRPTGRRPDVRRIVRGVRGISRFVGAPRRRLRRRRRARGISGVELRGFRKVIRLLAGFTGIAPQRLARRARPARRRF